MYDIDTVAVISLPRLGFNDFWGGAFAALSKAGIDRIRRTTGAFWDQSITLAMQQALDMNPKYLLCLDFDTIFTGDDVKIMRQLMDDYMPDALAAMQPARYRRGPLFSLLEEDGVLVSEIPESDLAHDVLRVNTAHLGLTFLSADKLRRTPKPWFFGQPDSNGEWIADKIDPDTWFWQQWAKAGNDLYVANRVAVGHLEAHIRWLTPDLQVTLQHPQDFQNEGKPEKTWK